MEKKQNGEKCTGTFTKRIGNTTYRVNVHFAEETTDTVEDKLLHLMGTVALTDEISSATDEAQEHKEVLRNAFPKKKCSMNR